MTHESTPENAECEPLLARYRAMAEEASDIVVLHEGGRIVCATGALWRLLKRTPAEFENGRFIDLVHPEDLAAARTLLGTPPPGKTWTATYRVRHANGHYVWFEVRTRGVYNEITGELLREVSVGRDITERKEHELSLKAALLRAEAANRAKSAFFGNLSHELRTPLNAIIGFADLMRAEILGPIGNARYSEYAHSICDAGRLLLETVSNLLELARIEAGAVALQKETIDPAPLIAECVEAMRSAAEKQGVTLSSLVCLPPFEADAESLRRIVLNLLSNAVKFTPAGGAVSVEARLENDTAVLRVRDTGPGMTADQLAHAGRSVERMFADALHAENAAGLGLGLAVVRALAAAQGGEMTIDSTPGRGTCAVIQFPKLVRVAAAA